MSELQAQATCEVEGRFFCTRRIQFCAGHRVHRHESKCRNLHGHNYVALITAEATALDALGRVIDFGVLKGVVGAWIDTAWDHGFIVWEEDDEARLALQGIPGQKVYVMPTNPTAENMAAHLKDVAQRLLDNEGAAVRVTKVTLWETENCYAES